MKLKKYEASFEKYLHVGGLPCVDVSIKDNKYIFLLDSGSDLSYIDSNVAEDLCLPFSSDGINNTIKTLGSEQMSAVTYSVPFILEKAHLQADFVGIEVKSTTNKLKVKFDGIIGINILRAIKSTMSFDDGTLKFSLNED